MTGPRVSRRTLILAHLEKHPGQTAYEISLALSDRRRGRSAAWSALRLLRDMEHKAQVVATTEWRPQQGRHVYLWHVAPPGTIPRPPRPVSAAEAERRRERHRAQKRRSRARQPAPVAPAAWDLPGPAACRGSDPDLFFPGPGQSADPAKAICATCSVRAKCLALALANGERYGIWGGVDLETEPELARLA